MEQVLVKRMEAEHIRDEEGAPFQKFYGRSENPHALWRIANARRISGYEPPDLASE